MIQEQHMQPCDNCGSPKPADWECSFQPPPVVESGSIKPRLKFVNVYSVTRHYGGPEEGGWWYNQGEPIASVPVVIGPPPPWVPEWFGKKADGSPGYPDFGHVSRAPEISAHDKARLEAKREELERMFEDVSEGDIYSMLGGTQLDVYIEDSTAEPFPQERPYYC